MEARLLDEEPAEVQHPRGRREVEHVAAVSPHASPQVHSGRHFYTIYKQGRGIEDQIARAVQREGVQGRRGGCYP